MAATVHTKGFIQDLAGLSDRGREQRIRLFFRRLLNQEGPNRSRVMKSLMEEVATLPADRRRMYLKARTVAMEGFPLGQQTELFSTHREILLAMPREQSEQEIQDLKSLIGEIDRKHHGMLERFIHFLPMGDDPTGKAVAGIDAPDARREREVRDQDQRSLGRR
ncbi:MAG: hypothetical protein HYX95_00050 [Chloroflexi bacterium]|nr:hypothetical protein [Chloroflexota bacterium]